MAERLYSEFSSDSGIDYRIGIHDADFVGDATEVKVRSGFTLDIDTPSRAFSESLAAGTLEFTVVIQDTNETFRDDIVSSRETRFSVAIEKGGDPYWYGALVPDIGQIKDEGPEYEMSLRAVCGLGLLADYEYIDESATSDKWTNMYSGFDRLISIISRCLKKLPHVQTHYTGSTDFIRTAINWHHSASVYDDPDNTNDPFYNVYVLNSQFNGIQTSGNAKPLSCAAVIDAILTAFNARIMQVGGRWMIEQYEARTNPTDNRVRRYEYASGAPSLSSFASAAVDIGPGNDNIKIAGGTYGYMKPAREAWVTLDAKTRYNLTEAMRFDETSAAAYDAGVVFWDGINSTFRAKGSIQGRFENTNIPVLTFPAPIALVFNLTTTLGTEYLDQTLQTNWPLPSSTQMEWSGSPASIEILIPLGFVPSPGDEVQFSQEFDFVISTPTGTQGDLTVNFEFDRLVNTANGATISDVTYDWVLTWDLNNPYFAIYYDEDIPIGKQVFQCLNNTYLNQGVIKTNTLIGDAVGLNDRGALRYLDTGEYFATADWKVRDTGTAYSISELLGRRILQAQSTPRRTINTTVWGPITPDFDTAIEYESILYFFLGGTFSAHLDQLQGRWVELEYESISISTAINGDTDTSNYNPPPVTGNTVNQNTGQTGGQADGNGIYTGSGIVPSGTVATVAASFNMNRTGASAGDEISFYVDDGTDNNQIKVEAGTGVRIVSTGDTITLEGETAFADVITAATINASQNDYAALAGGNTGRLSASAAYNITGIAGGTDGRIIALHNVGSENITLKNADTGSSAANRFDMGADFILRPKKGVIIQYDSTSSRWRAIASTGVSLSGSTNNIPIIEGENRLEGTSALKFDGSVLTVTSTGGTTIDLIETDASAADGGPYIRLLALPGASLNSGDRLGYIEFLGNEDSGNNGSGAIIEVFAEGDWSVGDRPAKLVFSTGASAVQSRVEILENGTLDALFNVRWRKLQIEDFNSETGTGTVTASSTVTDNLYNAGSLQATLTYNLPASPTDGQICRITFNQTVTTLTVSGNGNTINGTAAATAAPGTFLEYKYYHAASAWIRRH